jgi:hypothetical protein
MKTIARPPHFEPLTDKELDQFGARAGRVYDPDAGPLLDDVDSLRDNYRRLRQHHTLEVEWLWSELERARPGSSKLRKPPS